MTLIAAIDPGYEISAYLEWNGKEISSYGIIDNSEVIDWIIHSTAEYLFIEKVVCMGQAVGKEIFDTVFWSGRFYQVWIERKYNLSLRDKDDLLLIDDNDVMIPRSRIKKHFRAKNDSEVRKALIARYGKDLTKPLKSHLWQAFALAAWVTETNFLENE